MLVTIGVGVIDTWLNDKQKYGHSDNGWCLTLDIIMEDKSRLEGVRTIPRAWGCTWIVHHRIFRVRTFFSGKRRPLIIPCMMPVISRHVFDSCAGCLELWSLSVTYRCALKFVRFVDNDQVLEQRKNSEHTSIRFTVIFTFSIVNLCVCDLPPPPWSIFFFGTVSEPRCNRRPRWAWVETIRRTFWRQR